MAEEFRVDWRRPRGGLLLEVEGDLDLTSVGMLESCLQQVREDHRVRVDVEGVECADSSGIRVLAEAARRLADLGGDLTVCGASPRVARVFHLMGLGGLLEPGQPRGRSVAETAPAQRARHAASSTPAPTRRSWRTRRRTFAG